MVRLLTAMEAAQLEETLENCFALAKESEDIELMIDLSTAHQLLKKLAKVDISEVVR